MRTSRGGPRRGSGKPPVPLGDPRQSTSVPGALPRADDRDSGLSPQSGISRSPSAPLVLLIWNGERTLNRLQDHLRDGAVVVVAADVDIVREWLPEIGADTDRAPPSDIVVRLADLEVSLAEHRARWCGCVLNLTEQDLQILACLAASPGRVWTFAELLNRVWGSSYSGDLTSVRSAVKRLRRKLLEGGASLMIQSIRGIGFRLEAKVKVGNRIEEGLRLSPGQRRQAPIMWS